MKRRAFLQSLLAGGAVLTAVQRSKIEKQIEAEPAPSVEDNLPASEILVGHFPSEGGILRWREPVATHADLYDPAEDGDATWCENDDTIWVHIGNVGWTQLAAATLA